MTLDDLPRIVMTTKDGSKWLMTEAFAREVWANWTWGDTDEPFDIDGFSEQATDFIDVDEVLRRSHCIQMSDDLMATIFPGHATDYLGALPEWSVATPDDLEKVQADNDHL